MVRSLIVQLTTQCDVLPSSLASAYQNSAQGIQQPSTETLIDLLRWVINGFDHVYIILDALDECKSRKSLLGFINNVMGWCLPGLCMLVTIREEVDIKRALEPLVSSKQCLEADLVDKDIAVYVKDKILNDPSLSKWPMDIRSEIELTLGKGAHGMFLWAVCQIDAVRKCIKQSALRRTLASLPETLDETYQRILTSIDTEHQEDVAIVLQWLCHSVWPISLKEMIEILAIDMNPDPPTFRPDERMPDPLEILSICSNLVGIVTVSNDTRDGKPSVCEEQLVLAHYSVREYIVSDRIEIFPTSKFWISSRAAHVSLARSSLTYLLQLTVPTYTKEKRSRRCQEYPFACQAADTWWQYHNLVGNSSDRDSIDRLVHRLLESPLGCFSSWYDIRFGPTELRNGWYIWWCSSTMRTSPSSDHRVFGMSWLNLPHFVLYLVNELDLDPNGPMGKGYGAPLRETCKRNFPAVIKALLDGGADVAAVRPNPVASTPMREALCQRNDETVELLVTYGTNVVDYVVELCESMYSAILNNDLQRAQFLLKLGFNPSHDACEHDLSHRAQCGGVLYAIENNRVEILELMLKSRFQSQRLPEGLEYALFKALSCANAGCLRVLLAHGADAAKLSPDELREALSVCPPENLRLLRAHGVNLDLLLDVLVETGNVTSLKALLDLEAGLHIPRDMYNEKLKMAESRRNDRESTGLMGRHVAFSQGGESWDTLPKLFAMFSTMRLVSTPSLSHASKADEKQESDSKALGYT
ncbi:hypothetical protein MMC25_008238 [Agyrium rufum]|nr:hypothetical protein [Agyrium rufum]